MAAARWRAIACEQPEALGGSTKPTQPSASQGKSIFTMRWPEGRTDQLQQAPSTARRLPIVIGSAKMRAPPNVNSHLPEAHYVPLNCPSPASAIVPLSASLPSFPRMVAPPPQGSGPLMHSPSSLSSDHTTITLWEHVNVVDLAAEIGSGEFQRETCTMIDANMFPVVYKCFVERIMVPPRRQSAWSCESCRKWHHSARQSCVRCHANNSRVRKLFLGQLRKEVRCDDLLEKIVWAATVGGDGNGGVVPIRVDEHVDSPQPMSGSAVVQPPLRKGCGSIYVPTAEAERLVQLIHRNVFLDIDWATGAEVLYFCYSEQRAWFDGFIALRVARSGALRPPTMPVNPVVCELATDHSRL